MKTREWVQVLTSAHLEQINLGWLFKEVQV